MFCTLKILGVLSIPTFLFGNRALRAKAAARIAASEKEKVD